MRRRHVLGCLAQLALSTAMLPRLACAQPLPARFADMHTHLGFRSSRSIREATARGGMLIVADKIVADGPLLHRVRGRHSASRESRVARPGPGSCGAISTRRSGAGSSARARCAAADRIAPGPGARHDHPDAAVVIASEGADFIEGDADYLETVRRRGLVHLQLVHYYTPSLIGDVATEPATHGGLTRFGKELVRGCNRLGILIDVAHCTSEGIAQVLEISTQPVVYSHGHVSDTAPHPSQHVVAARALHRPLAQRIAAQGGVIGLWPLSPPWRDLAHFADELVAMADRLGSAHVGIGTDINGLPGTVIPSYGEFAQLPALLTDRGVSATDIAAMLGGNYLRVLRSALQVAG